MRLFIIIILLFLIDSVYSQNHVTNGDFEKYSQCPDGKGQLNRAIGWHGIWGGGGSCEYYNACATYWKYSTPKNWVGFQQTRSGNGYIGHGFYGRNSNHVVEFSANDLNDTLMKGVTYNVKIYLSIHNSSSLAISEIGIHITDSIDANSIYSGNTTPEVINQKGFIYDTLNWVKIEGQYKAKGGEKYIVIGCFNPNPQDTILNNSGGESVYYLIEDVAIYPINAPISTAKTINDTLICKGNKISLGLTQVEPKYKAEYKWLWYKMGKEKDTLSTEAFPVFQPDSTTTYVLKLTDFKYDITYDTVKLTVVDCKQPTSLKVYPNPTNDIVFFGFDSPIPKGLHIELFNILGQKIKSLNYLQDYQHNTVQLNLSTLATGLYFYRVVINGDIKFVGKIIRI